MGERLRLTRTFGVAGWQAWHADGDGFVLAALGTCLLTPGTSLALRGLWRLARLWRGGLDTIDPAALRLALAMQRDVRVSGIDVRVELAPPAHELRPHAFRLALSGQRRDAHLPAADDGCTWTVLALAPAGRRTLAAMTTALRAAPRGTRLTIDLCARVSRAPDTLRAGFPLRAEARIDDAGWFPLIRATRIDVARALGGNDGAWTSSTSHN